MIQVKNLTKKYPQYTGQYRSYKSVFLNLFKFIKERMNKDCFYAVKDLNFKIENAEILCIMGPNGAGKSTLAKMLAGTISPTQGSIEIQGKIVPFLELGVAFNHELTATDNYYLNGTLLGLSIDFLKANKQKIFDYAEVSDFMNTPLKFFSSGMMLRLAFAIAMHSKGDVYIFDEILAVGDLSFQKKCMDSFHNLLESGKTIIVVTHSTDFAIQYATKLLIVSNSRHKLVEDIKCYDKAELERMVQGNF